MSDDGLNIWTIYDRPTDFPDVFVVRLSIVSQRGPETTSVVLYSDDIEELREVMRSQGLICIPRYAEDDPKIVEVWL
jgi:hypothetical protein